MIQNNYNYVEKFFCEKRNASTPLGIEAKDLSIASRMLYHLSYEDSTQFFSQNLYTPHPAAGIP